MVETSLKLEHHPTNLLHLETLNIIMILDHWIIGNSNFRLQNFIGAIKYQELSAVEHSEAAIFWKIFGRIFTWLTCNSEDDPVGNVKSEDGDGLAALPPLQWHEMLVQRGHGVITAELGIWSLPMGNYWDWELSGPGREGAMLRHNRSFYTPLGLQ